MSEYTYPTETDLERVRTWDAKDPVGWLAYVNSLWWAPDWGWKEYVDPGKPGRSVYFVSTGGWSGNEAIISAMQEHWILWLTLWESTRRGGHYVFATIPTEETQRRSAYRMRQKRRPIHDS